MTKMTTRKEILVYANWIGIPEPLLMGSLFADVVRGEEIFSFEYSDTWLKSKFAQVIDPDLQLFTGPQYINDNKRNFGIFLDSSPDRWGRVLMERREAILAREEQRTAKKLMESDFLLGVYDENRIGGLRFKEKEEGAFLNQDQRLAAPPWAKLSELQEASLKIEKDDTKSDYEYLKWLNMLIAPGSSLGGARPKASVIDDSGDLWIAKFPSLNDTKDIGGWEMVVHDLAKECNINVAEAIVKKFSHKHHAFLTKRFDREKGKRIHFASAMTLLGYKDGTDYHVGASYLELADFITTNGANVNNDLEELWKRIVFSISVSNTDDHLRNHAFILTEKGWILSPAFDINPNESGTGLNLNISENDNSLNFDLALDVAGYFRLDKPKAEKVIKDIKSRVRKWKSVAEIYKIPNSEQLIMEKAFKV